MSCKELKKPKKCFAKLEKFNIASRQQKNEKNSSKNRRNSIIASRKSKDPKLLGLIQKKKPKIALQHLKNLQIASLNLKN